MILADKIMAERKKNGWSQEELAEKIGVTRQAVSKWEGAQSTPDLQKLLQMSNVFGVTADYLLKDELEDVDYIQSMEDSDNNVRKVSMEEANHFLKVKKETAPKIALGTMLCMISPICVMILAVGAEIGIFPISEDIAGGLGMIVMFLIIAGAVAIFISCGAKTKDYEFLEKERIETEYGVTGMVKERKKQYEEKYTRFNILGTVSCILGIVPIFSIAVVGDNDFFAVLMVGLLLFIEAVGVRFFIIGGINQASFEKLLQEGDYTVDEKRRSPMVTMVSTVYWLVVTAIFLCLSFFTTEWEYTGLIWPIAGVLYAAVIAVVKYLDKK